MTNRFIIEIFSALLAVRQFQGLCCLSNSRTAVCTSHVKYQSAPAVWSEVWKKAGFRILENPQAYISDYFFMELLELSAAVVYFSVLVIIDDLNNIWICHILYHFLLNFRASNFVDFCVEPLYF